MLRTPSSFVVIGNPGCPRVAYFTAAVQSCGLGAPVLVSYADLLAGRVTLEQFVTPGCVVRLESPGRAFEVERGLLALGADEPDDGSWRLSRRDVADLTFDKGRIWAPRQWYLGFCALLRQLAAQLARCPPSVVLNPPDDVALLFDKVRCQDAFARAGIPVPRGLDPVRSYAELRERMRAANCNRVFVKLAHGSSASGVVAYQSNGAALTTVEMVRAGGELRLYNSRRLQRYHDPADLIDALAREGVRVEEWLPKATLGDHEFDLRVVVIAGTAQHIVVRTSRTPMTNLHLGNERGDLAALVAQLPPDAWSAALRTCERAAGVIPGSLQVGVDLLIGPDQRHAVLEANAFGDLLPGVLCAGLDTYEAEVRAVGAG